MNRDYSKRKIGKNVKALAAHITARQAGNSISDFMEFIVDINRFKHTTLSSFRLAFGMIDEIKATKDNPYGDDDEVIAGLIVNEIDVRLKGYRK